MFGLPFLCSAAFVTLAFNAGNVHAVDFVFDKEFVGVGYSPYTKQWEDDGTLPAWSTYTSAQVECQLRLIAKRFSAVSTYNFGTNDSVTSRVSRIAAKINAENSNLLLTIDQGINQIQNPQLQYEEITNALKGSVAANQIYPGTVRAITINWEHGQSSAEGDKIIKILSIIADSCRSGGEWCDLEIGVRTQNCETAFSPLKYPDIVGVLNTIIQQSDYIMCNFYPDFDSALKGVDAAVDNVAQTYTTFTDLAKTVNPNIVVVIGETGWPSEGVAFNGSPTSVQNLVEYWRKIWERASEAGVMVYMFEAFDEPWKSNLTNQNPTDPEGFNGGEGHYGWWTQVSNDMPCQFIEKATGITFSI